MNHVLPLSLLILGPVSARAQASALSQLKDDAGPAAVAAAPAVADPAAVAKDDRSAVDERDVQSIVATMNLLRGKVTWRLVDKSMDVMPPQVVAQALPDSFVSRLSLAQATEIAEAMRAERPSGFWKKLSFDFGMPAVSKQDFLARWSRLQRKQ